METTKEMCFQWRMIMKRIMAWIPEEKAVITVEEVSYAKAAYEMFDETDNLISIRQK